MTLSEAFGFAAGAIPNLFAMSVLISALAFALVALFFTVAHASHKKNRKKRPYGLSSASVRVSAKDIVSSSNKKIKMRLDDDDDYKGSSSNSSSSFFIHSGSSSGSGYRSSSSCGGSSDSGGDSGGGGGSCGGGD